MTVPSWATIRPKRSSGSTARSRGSNADSVVPSTHRSLELIRVESARQWLYRIRQAERLAWNQVVRDLVNDTQMGSSSTEPTTIPQHTMEEQDEDNWISRYTMNPPAPSNYPWELLPVLVIVPPPCVVDRHAVSEALWSAYRDETSDKRVCSILLPRLLPTLHATFHLILRQCLQQEPSQRLQYLTRNMRKAKKRGQSIQQSIIWWASQTEAFREIVLILEDAGGFDQAKLRHEFVETLQQLRQEHGVPVSLVAMTRGNNSGEQFLSGGGGCMLRLRHVSVVDYTEGIQDFENNRQEQRSWMRSFWKHLTPPIDLGSESQCPPMPFDSFQAIQHIIHEFTHSTFSYSHFVESILQQVLHFYQSNGSFVWDTLQQDPEFLVWFATYSTAKDLLSPQSGQMKLMAFRQCHQIQSHIQWWWKWQLSFIPLLCSTNRALNDKLPVGRVWKTLVDLMPLTTTLPTTDDQKYNIHNQSQPLPASLEHYLSRGHPISKGTKKDKKKQLAAEDSYTNAMSQRRKAATLLHELVILVHTAMKDNNSQQDTKRQQWMEEGLWRMLTELHELVLENLQSLMTRWQESNPLSPSSSEDHEPTKSIDGSNMTLAIQHRRNIVAGLPSRWAKQMYDLLEDRVAISREEWLHAFGGTTTEFSRGAWDLILSGLIQSKPKRGGGIVYEKVSVVWC